MSLSTCKICFKPFKIRSGCIGIYCSRLCADNGTRLRARKKANNELIIKLELYILNPTLCSNADCGKVLEYRKRNNKYCSLSCGAIVANKFRKKEKLVSSKRISELVSRKCPTCNIEFICRELSTKVHCSKNCIRRGGFRQTSVRSKHGHYKGIYCSSTWELCFLIYHLDQGSNISRCLKKFKYEYNGKEHNYYPDFEIDNIIYEIKGQINEVDLIKVSVANAVMIYGDNIKKYLKYVSEKYKVAKNKFFTLYDNPETAECKFCLNVFIKGFKSQLYCNRICGGKGTKKQDTKNNVN